MRKLPDQDDVTGETLLPLTKDYKLRKSLVLIMNVV